MQIKQSNVRYVEQSQIKYFCFCRASNSTKLLIGSSLKCLCFLETNQFTQVQGGNKFIPAQTRRLFCWQKNECFKCGYSSDAFKSNQKVELSNQTWANNSNCDANHSNRISANSMRMPIAFSLGFPFKFSAKGSKNFSSNVYQYYKY